MVSEQYFFFACVIILAAALFVPVSRFIWVMSVRRLERKSQRELTDEERNGQHRRARILALVVTVIFSILFNISTLGLPQSG